MNESNVLSDTLPADRKHLRVEHSNGETNKSKKQLEEELADARLLHTLSIQLIQEDGTAGLYKKIVEAAVELMGSQYGSMQMLYPDSIGIGKLRLLASCNFTPEAEQFWEWVTLRTGSSCGAALRAQRRVIVSDFATCDFMQGTITLPIILGAGIKAAQSTPLVSRTGKLLGMITTHWDHTHTPSERHLYLMDVLARQASDLIERTQTAEALRQSEERLRALTTATNDVIYRMSPDWSEMYHLDGRNFLNDTGSPISDWLQKYIHPNDRDELTTAIRLAVESKSAFQLEHRVLKADNTYGWTLSRAIPIIDEYGHITEWFGAAGDVTEKRSLMTLLENRVEDRTRELQRSNEDLQQFAHVASHDLKEPVRKIRTYGLRLREELNGNSNETLKHCTEKILESAGRMFTMIEGVLTYSSLNAVQEDTESVDLNNILSDIRNDLEVLIQQKRAVLHYEVLPEIEGIEVLIYQLFYNIINNSLKFSKVNEIPRITISSKPISIAGTDHVRIAISDTGIGFDPLHNAAIFGTFTRLHSKHKYDGTGLGLSLAKKIVERHFGTITAHGKKDHGAVFTITLPAKQPRK